MRKLLTRNGREGEGRAGFGKKRLDSHHARNPSPYFTRIK